MVIRAKFLTEITNGVPIVLRCVYVSLSRFSLTEKLAHNNHQMWRAQVLSALRGAQLVGFISASAQPPAAFLPQPKDSKNKDVAPLPNPEYETWIAKDQQVLKYLLSSMSREVLSQISTAVSAAAAWHYVDCICRGGFRYFASRPY